MEILEEKIRTKKLSEKIPEAKNSFTKFLQKSSWSQKFPLKKFLKPKLLNGKIAAAENFFFFFFLFIWFKEQFNNKI